MRFNTPEEVEAWADKVARVDYEKHVFIHTDQDGTQWQVDKNPYCTQGARNDWQRGFDNAQPRAWEGTFDYLLAYQRGKSMKRLLSNVEATRLIIKSRLDQCKDPENTTSGLAT